MTLEFNTTAYLLVFLRMGGMIFFNPLFMRRNIPARFKMGFVLALTLLIAPMTDTSHLGYLSGIELVTAMLRETLVGLACAYVFLVFYYLLFFAGDVLDMQFGLSMARVFDPGTNIQASVSGNLLGYLFLIFFFVTDSHLILLRLFMTSFEVVPAGTVTLGAGAAQFLIDMFVSAFSLIIRLTLPFVAAEFVLEVGMGVLMKLIPQIHVFVINIQFKVILGLFMLFAFARPIAGFLDNYLGALLDNMMGALSVIAG